MTVFDLTVQCYRKATSSTSSLGWHSLSSSFYSSLVDGLLAMRMSMLWSVLSTPANFVIDADCQGVFMVGLVVGCAYFIFKLVRIWQLEDTTYYRLTKSLTVFDVLSLASLASCFVLGVIVWRDFGKGLKEAGEPNRQDEWSLRLIKVANQKGTQSLHSFAGRKKRSKAEEESAQPEIDLHSRRISLD